MIFAVFNSQDQIIAKDMGEAYSTYGGDEWSTQSFGMARE
jgi:hypothetical protein